MQLYRMFLPRLLANACESRIPRSGKSGEEVNCYVVALDRDDKPYFVATGIDGNTLTGLKYDGQSYAGDHKLSITELDNGALNITHFYGLSEVSYNSIYKLAWHYCTKLVYLKIHIYRYIDSTSQYFFNKKKLVTKKRMDLLKFMMEDQLDRDHDGIKALSLMTKIYTMRMFLHPSWETQMKKLKLYLDSLVQSGELRQVNDEYVVTGVAICTIERYEEEERRHSEAVKLQRRMFWIALIALLFAVVQTGVVKLPTVIDYSGSDDVTHAHVGRTQ